MGHTAKGPVRAEGGELRHPSLREGRFDTLPSGCLEFYPLPAIEKKASASDEKLNVKDLVYECLNKQDNSGWTPLLVGVCRNHVGFVDFLLTQPEVDIELKLSHSCPPSQGSEKTQSSALHFAAIQGNAQIIKRILQKGAKSESVLVPTNPTPLSLVSGLTG